MARAAALLLLLLGLLPLANWIPGGHDAPWYGQRLALWGSGGAIVAGVALVAAIVLRRRPELWRTGAWDRLATRWQRADRRADAGIAAIATLLCAVVARVVLSARPLLIDEVIQLWQARVFAAGRLFLPVPAHPEFTAAMHLVDTGDRLYGQFPAGGPAMLALGELLGAAWLVGPVFTGLAVFAFARLVRRIETGAGVQLAAVLLLAFAPFTVFLGGSMMNHVTASAWLVVAALALVRATADASPRAVAAWWAGLALGIAATIRPLDAAALALPTAAWLLWRMRLGRRHLAPLLASGLGIALPIAVLLAMNAAWTGDPLRFGYIELWGRTHELGFHESPWGPPHTPLRGLELINLYLLRLQTHFLETPAPGLLFATAALLLVPRLAAFDRWMLAGSGLFLAAYFAYWHDGFYLGPRFLLPLTPWVALWTARLPAVLRARGLAPRVERPVIVAGLTAMLMGVTQLVPIRATQYRNGMLSMRHDVAALTAERELAGATILVRESWGAQLIARMWGLGVSRPDAERMYRSVDSCTLDSLISTVEAVNGDGVVLAERVAPHRADSARLVAQYFSPDTTLRALPDRPLRPVCERRILEDRSGTTVYAPLLVTRDTANRYLRDLHVRDTLLGDDMLSRPLWLLSQEPGPGGALRLTPVNRDSMRAAWGSDAR